MPRRLLLAAVTVVGVACQSGSQPYRGLSVASTTPPSSLLRLAADGGAAQLYHLPKLDPWGWETQPLPPLRRPIGADLDLAVVYALGTKNEIVALDLLTARPRPQLASGVREVTEGPDGTLFTVDDSLHVVQFVRRNPTRFQAPLTSRPRDLFGTRTSALLAVSTSPTTTLTLLRSDDPPVKAPLPAGDAAATFWGDLVAVAADSAVVLLDPDKPDQPVSIPVSGHARSVLFSPSGHRFYVARREGPVLVFNRFTREQVASISLPGPAAALRSDPFGRWLLVHPQGHDSLWLVDMARNRRVDAVASEWGPDLPTVTNQQTLLVKAGGDVVAYDLTTEDHRESGRIKGGAKDFWLPLAWTPETGTASIASAADSAAAPADTTEPSSRVYLQVSSSQNRSWAAELARQLEQQGLPAAVLDPRGPDEGYRVVLGPYPTRETAESTGKRLGRPFFIYQPDR